ncbi:Homeobox protein ceh-5 [Thelohanellus kitauei]|uniref:Homeobox protein ceh-5 n=1 Tax=Thelohanellus kitauei TaxID=669202 RepID=A0A0C2JUB9_THEKT|nr:Homeobox protein ceh-5 [Thelohanellus kitauei]
MEDQDDEGKIPQTDPTPITDSANPESDHGNNQPSGFVLEQGLDRPQTGIEHEPIVWIPQSAMPYAPPLPFLSPTFSVQNVCNGMHPNSSYTTNPPKNNSLTTDFPDTLNLPSRYRIKHDLRNIDIDQPNLWYLTRGETKCIRPDNKYSHIRTYCGIQNVTGSKFSKNPDSCRHHESNHHVIGKIRRSCQWIRKRTVFTHEQISRMNEVFKVHPYLMGTARDSLSREIGLPEKQIKIWWQNKRKKERISLTTWEPPINSNPCQQSEDDDDDDDDDDEPHATEDMAF